MRLLIVTILAIVLFSGCTGKKEVQRIDLRKMWDFNDPAGTEARFMELLPQFEDDGEFTLEIKTQIARTMGLRGMFENAHALLDSVDADLGSEINVARIRSLLERGRLFNSARDPKNAVPLFEEAWKLAKETSNDNLAIDAAHMLAIVMPPEGQLEWNLKALDLVEKSADSTLVGWKGPLYNNIGWTYFDQGDPETGLMYFLKDVNFRGEIGDENGSRIAQWSTARMYRALGRNEEAMMLQHRIEKEIEDNDLPRDGYVFEELGELYAESGDKGKAESYFKSAYEVLKNDPWLQQNDKEKLAHLRKLGGVKE